MLKFLVVVLAMTMLAVPPAGQTQQTYDTEEVKNTKQARAALDAMVQALGGDAWLNMKNQVREGHIAAFYHGNPNLGTTTTESNSRRIGTSCSFTSAEKVGKLPIAGRRRFRRIR